MWPPWVGGVVGPEQAPRPGRPHRAAPTEFSPLVGAACGMRVSPRQGWVEGWERGLGSEGPSVRLLPRLEAADQLHGGGALGSRTPGAAPGLVLEPLLPAQDLRDLVQIQVVVGLGGMEMLEDHADGYLPGGAVPQIPRNRIVHRSMPHLYASFQSSTAQPLPPSKGSSG